MIAQFAQDFPAPIRRAGDTAVELVADYYRGSTIKPEVNLDWERLSQGDMSARLAVKTAAGEVHNISLTVGASGREVLARIRERYSAREDLADDELFEIDVYPLGVLDRTAAYSSAEKVNDLIHWQQFMDMTDVLEAGGEEGQDWEELREMLRFTVGRLYENNFEQLRGQLRNERAGADFIRQLLRTRNEAFVDIALRLTRLEPSLAVEVREELTAVAADPSLNEDLRKRASSQLTAT